MLTPQRTILLLRLVTGLAVCGLLATTLGPFQGHEQRLGLSDKAAHVSAFYLISLLLFAVAPQRRRSDLALVMLGLGVAIELAQGLLGRSLSLADLLADGVGVAAAIAPAWVERLRYLARRHPYLPFAAALDADRRRPSSRSSTLKGGATVEAGVSEESEGWR